MRTFSWLIFATLLAMATTSGAAEQGPLTREQERALRARYPQVWEITVPAGTALARLKSRYEPRLQRIPTRDLEDQAPYPPWFRAFLRDQFRGLPTAGPYQYPRVAAQILEWMVAHPALKSPPPSPPRSAAAEAATRAVVVGTNINITNIDERNSESFIAIDYSNPQFLIAGSNNISGSGRQKQFASSNGGATWSKTELSLATGTQFQSDPAVAWTTDGTAWAATLGINSSPSTIKVQVFKSTDRGMTWSFVSTVSTGNNNDKELMWIDTHPTSPFKDNIYVAWDQPGGGMRFARSTNKGVSWSGVTTLSNDAAIGAHLATGPAGELYVAWPDTGSRELRIRKSTDGGATFSATKVIAKTKDSFEISIPAMCQRKALIYISLGVDRSNGPRKGSVYAAWTDRNGTAADPDCGGITAASNSNVYLSRSTDGGNTWSPSLIIHSDAPQTDQFNQWMDVDPDDGMIHAMYYDTRDDPGRKKTHVYYIASQDGGTTWINATKVTTAETDETAGGADLGNQYGDYNGMVAFRGIANPVWTDRRSGVPGGKEQIFTTAVRRGIVMPPIDFGLCRQRPWLCNQVAELIQGQLTLECNIRGCLNYDPIPKNCLVKFSCPGCSPGGLCPPFYNISLDGLDPVWQVGVFDPKGEQASFTQAKTGTSTVLSFRPTKENFIDGQIGDYFLVFQMGPEGKLGQKYEVKTSLKVSDQPFSP
jgi:hypothetical protein